MVSESEPPSPTSVSRCVAAGRRVRVVGGLVGAMRDDGCRSLWLTLCAASRVSSSHPEDDDDDDDVNNKRTPLQAFDRRVAVCAARRTRSSDKVSAYCSGAVPVKIIAAFTIT